MAQGAININTAQIAADGGDGGNATNGGGGGSGGTIGIFSETSIFADSSAFKARGGNGGNNAGGGGGGYIILIAPSVIAAPAVNEAVDTAGGAGFQNGGNGKVNVRNEAPHFWAP